MFNCDQQWEIKHNWINVHQKRHGFPDNSGWELPTPPKNEATHLEWKGQVAVSPHNSILHLAVCVFLFSKMKFHGVGYNEKRSTGGSKRWMGWNKETVMLHTANGFKSLWTCFPGILWLPNCSGNLKLDCDLKGRLLQWQEHGIYGHSISSFVLSVIMIYWLYMVAMCHVKLQSKWGLLMAGNIIELG